jgi:putative PEP-CTERM system TPR-repeat lipoprotein
MNNKRLFSKLLLWKFAPIVAASALAGVIYSPATYAANLYVPQDSGYNADIASFVKARDYNGAIAYIQKLTSEGKANKSTYITLANIYLETGAGIAAETAVDRAKALGASFQETAIPYAKAFLVQGMYEKAINILSGTEIAEAQQGQALIIMADANFAEGRFDVARRIYEQANQRFPNDFSAYLGLARLDLRSGNLERAVEYLRLAELYAPNNTMVHYTSGLAKQYQGDEAAAEAYFLKAIDLFPGNLLANIELASLNIARADFARAEQYLDKVYEGTPNHPLALYMSAVIATQNGDYKLADNLLGRTRRLTERFLPAMYLRAIVAYALDDYSQAIYVLERALRALPNGVEIRTLLAATYLRRERYSDAFSIIESVVSSVDRTRNHLILAGAALSGMGRTAEARTYFTQAQVNAETDEAAASNINQQIQLSSILSSYVLEEGPAAISAFEQVVGSQKADLRNLGILASMQMRANEYSDAEKTIRKILDVAPERALGQNMLGSLYYRTGKFDQAIAAYDQALLLNGNYSAALKNRALANMALGNFTAVEQDIRDFVRDNPSDMQALALLAKSLLEQKLAPKLEEAVSLFKTVSATFPNDVGLAVDYARALDRSGDRQGAVKLLRAIARRPVPSSKLSNIGEQLLELGAFAPASGILSRYRVSGDDPLRANILYGRALLHSGLNTGALNAFKQALKLSPNEEILGKLNWYIFAASYQTLSKADVISELTALDRRAIPADLSLAIIGKAHASKGDLDKAIEAYASILAGDAITDDVDVVLSMVEALQKRLDAGDINRAAQLLRDHVVTKPANVELRSKLADLLFNQREYDEAIEQLEILIRNGNVSAKNLAKIARAYQETKTGEPLIFSDRARLIAPNDPFVLDIYGWILLQQERDIDGALQAFETALKRQENNGLIQYHYAMALLAAGRENDAVSALEIALMSDDDFNGKLEAKRQLAILKR